MAGQPNRIIRSSAEDSSHRPGTSSAVWQDWYGTVKSSSSSAAMTQLMADASPSFRPAPFIMMDLFTRLQYMEDRFTELEKSNIEHRERLAISESDKKRMEERRSAFELTNRLLQARMESMEAALSGKAEAKELRDLKAYTSHNFRQKALLTKSGHPAERRQPRPGALDTTLTAVSATPVNATRYVATAHRAAAGDAVPEVGKASTPIRHACAVAKRVSFAETKAEEQSVPIQSRYGETTAFLMLPKADDSAAVKSNSTEADRQALESRSSVTAVPSTSNPSDVHSGQHSDNTITTTSCDTNTSAIDKTYAAAEVVLERRDNGNATVHDARQPDKGCGPIFKQEPKSLLADYSSEMHLGVPGCGQQMPQDEWAREEERVDESFRNLLQNKQQAPYPTPDSEMASGRLQYQAMIDTSRSLDVSCPASHRPKHSVPIAEQECFEPFLIALNELQLANGHNAVDNRSVVRKADELTPDWQNESGTHSQREFRTLLLARFDIEELDVASTGAKLLRLRSYTPLKERIQKESRSDRLSSSDTVLVGALAEQLSLRASRTLKPEDVDVLIHILELHGHAAPGQPMARNLSVSELGTHLSSDEHEAMKDLGGQRTLLGFCDSASRYANIRLDLEAGKQPELWLNHIGKPLNWKTGSTQYWERKFRRRCRERAAAAATASLHREAALPIPLGIREAPPRPHREPTSLPPRIVERTKRKLSADEAPRKALRKDDGEVMPISPPHSPSSTLQSPPHEHRRRVGAQGKQDINERLVHFSAPRPLFPLPQKPVTLRHDVMLKPHSSIAGASAANSIEVLD